MILERAGKRRWLVWALLCLAVIAVHISTLPFDSRISQDQVQIVEYGRASLQPDEPWSMSWNIQKQMPVLSISYLGPVLQELAFSLTAPNEKGVMLSSLLGAVFAATFAMGWLIARQVPLCVSLILAFAFLVDPAFSITYRDGRIDSWAMAAVLATCWLLRHSVLIPSRKIKKNWAVFFAGITSALAVFIWPTVAMLAPLVLLEFVHLLRSPIHRESMGWLPVSTSLIACFALGGAITIGLLSIPILTHWEIYFEGLKTSVAIQSWASAIQPPIIDMIIAHDPMIVIVAISALLIKRDFGLMLAFAAAITMAWQTMIYPARLIYFLPYVLAMIGTAAQAVWHKQPVGLGKAVLKRLLAMLLMWNATIVLVIRPFVAFQQQAFAQSEELITELNRVIGEGEYRVLASEWSPYFAGRALGWHTFRQGSPVTIDQYEKFLPTMDYILVEKKPRYPALSNLLQNENFELLEQIDFKQYRRRIIYLGFIQIPIPAKGYEQILVYRPVKRAEIN